MNTKKWRTSSTNQHPNLHITSKETSLKQSTRHQMATNIIGSDRPEERPSRRPCWRLSTLAEYPWTKLWGILRSNSSWSAMISSTTTIHDRPAAFPSCSPNQALSTLNFLLIRFWEIIKVHQRINNHVRSNLTLPEIRVATGEKVDLNHTGIPITRCTTKASGYSRTGTCSKRTSWLLRAGLSEQPSWGRNGLT